MIVKHDEVPVKIPGGKSGPLPTENPTVKTESGGSTKTEQESPQTDSHPIQEGVPALMN
ncbi:hypothetical protein HYS91_00760 [Candidatus Daviesbacteria bacterium]|nr:hypothetical protein [Candidatus Daviesbacteria bacterium]